MATLIKQPSVLCFSSVVDDIVFSTASSSAVLQLNVAYGGEDYTVLDETLYPNADGTIVIGDLSSMLEPYCRQKLQVVVTCSLTDGAGTAAISPVTVLYAMVDVGQPAGDFTASHFLTILDGAKRTSRGWEERLYTYANEAIDEVEVSATVRTLAGAVVVLDTVLPANSVTDGISQFDTSADTVALALGLEDEQLLAYTVSAGNRSQEFQVTESSSEPSPSLVFTNSFGCQEFIYCTGSHKKTSDYEREATRIGGMMTNYRIRENRKFQANTGWLSQAMANWADELFRSQEVYLWADGTVGRQVLVTESKSEISNDDDSMPSFSFTWSYAQRIHNVMQPAHAGRVFDNTFDYTFN